MAEILLSEKYRPKTLEECILPKSTQELASSIIEKGEIPNLLFIGSAGTGKTTLAKVLAKELDYEYLFINASNEGRSIDTLRTTITDFATETSLTGKNKLVILDEFDGTTDIVQEALRGFFEKYSATCSFILTANNVNKIKAPIISRFTQIDFRLPPEEKGILAVNFAKRIVVICDKEGIKYDKSAIAELIKIDFPDFRQTLNKLQLALVSMKLDSDTLKSFETPTKAIIEGLKAKDFKGLRKIVANIPNANVTDINNDFKIVMDDVVTAQTVPTLIMILSDYDYKSHFVVDMELCIMSMFIEIMSNVEFK